MLPTSRIVTEDSGPSLESAAPDFEQARHGEDGPAEVGFASPASRNESCEVPQPKTHPFVKENFIVAIVLAGIGLHLVLRYPLRLSRPVYEFPLLAVLVVGGLPLVYELALKALHK